MRILASLSFLLVIGACCSCARLERQNVVGEKVRPGPGVYFVATNGLDSWSGMTPSPSRGLDNGPFRTLTCALRTVGDLKQWQGGAWKQPVTIYVRGGTHWLTEPVVLTPELSGTVEAPLRIIAYPGEHPILSAGRPVRNWQAVTIEGRHLWKATVAKASEGGEFFRQLWVNGERRTRARHPNRGYLKIAALPDATATWENGHKRFQFKPGDVLPWPSATNGDAVVMTRWVESRLPIVGIDEKQNVLSASKRSVFQLQPGDPYYIEHVFEALDEPGEWYLDRQKGLVYYLPLPGETLENFEATAPRFPDCLRLEGNPAAGAFVDYVQFRGLIFSHNEWYFSPNFGSEERHISTTPDPEIYGFAQASFGIPGAVRAKGARHCSFTGCGFVNLGSYGLQLGLGCQSNVVSACRFYDLAAGGIRLGETLIRTNLLEQPHDNTVEDCEIADGGKMFHSGEGIWIGQSYGNRIAHNSIHDFFYTGISIGWTWGYEGSLASNNIIEFNHVHHIGQKSNGDGPILSDMGGIYTLGMQPGTIIRNNLWHDIHGVGYGGWGIYLDEGSSGISVSNNVVFRTTHGGFHQHYGKENIVRNNVFAYGRDCQLQRTRAEDHRSFTFERNIVLFNQGNLLEGDWEGGKFTQDYNLYCDTRTNALAHLNFPGGWEKWRTNGHDAHSILANPRVATTNLAQFKLEAESPALQLGFKPIDMKQVGPRKERVR